LLLIEELKIKTPTKEILIDITDKIQNIITISGISEGVCRIFIPHTTAGITINENTDPSVKKDIISFLKKLVPQNANFEHLEGNSDAHIKSILMGFSLEILIYNRKLKLGI